MIMIKWLKNFWRRFDWSWASTTILGALLVAAIYPLMKWAPAEWFKEYSWAENLQLAALAVGIGLALCVKYEKKMFVLLAFVLLFLMVREVNGGRMFFCKLFLATAGDCHWSDMKYGWLADWVRWGIGISVLIFALKSKVWRPLIKYVLKAPIFVWDILILLLAVTGSWAAELPCVDNEILEESSELLMYVMLAGLVWRYGRVAVT